MGKMDKALAHFNAALDGSTSPENAGIRVMTLNNLGIVYEKFGNDKMALRYLDEALQLTNTRQMTDAYARVIITRSSIISKKDPQKALETLEDAFIRIKPLQMPSLMVELCEEMVDAYEKAQLQPFDLVLTDQNMPRLDGLGLTRRLRDHPQFKTVPILVLTTESSDLMKQAGRAAGATGWLVKPFDPARLLEVIKKVIR